MLHHRRLFQHYSNRLRQHIFVSANEHVTQHTPKVMGCCHQIDRLKCDTMAHKNRIQYLNTDDLIHDTPNNTHISTDKPLPFDAIPCADPPNTSKFSQWFTIAHQLKQLLTSNWDSRFHEDIDECHRRLGPIFRKSLTPNFSAIFVQSPELLRDVFVYEGKYPKHPLPEAWTYYNQLHNCQRGLFFMEDAEWLDTRKQLAPLMLRNDHRFFGIIESATDDFIDNWKKTAVQHHEWTEMPLALTTLYGWSIRVLMGIMFGNVSHKMCHELHETIDHFGQIVQNVFEDTVPFASISPQLARKLHLPIWKKFETSVTDTLSIADQIIEYGLKQPQYDGLLGEMKHLNMEIELIKRIFIDLIIAAGDTTAFSTQWALYLLAKNPTKQDHLRAELLTSDKHDTPLCRGTVREALRLFPVATLVGRILGKDAILDKYYVNKHTLVLISIYSAGRDETSFPNANQFEPGRWNRDPITGTLKLVNRAQSSIPYAMGARNCIGQRIANAQMYIILSKLLRTFKVQLLNANEIDIVMRLIIMPSKPMRFAVKRID